MGDLRPADPEQSELHEIADLLAVARQRLLARNQPLHARVVEAVYRARRIRDAAFGVDAAIFGEPAWDILLDLYMAELAERRLSVSSACIGANVPTTTAMRHLAILEAHGLVERSRDVQDGRRSFVGLTERGRRAMDGWVERMLRTIGKMTDLR